MSYKVAGIDVHKKVLMVVVAEVEASQAEWSLQRRRFGTTTSELRQLAGWLREQALWAIAHRLCRLVWKILHQGVSCIEHGAARDPKARKQRARVLIRKLRQLGYKVEITPLTLATAEA